MPRKPPLPEKREEPGPRATVPDPEVVLPPEARPVPGRPFYRYTFSARGTHVDVDALYDEARRRKQLAELITLEAGNIERGMRFGGDKKRGRSKLYREAEAVLDRRGIKTPAETVMRALERRGVLLIENKNAVLRKMVLRWNDDKGRSKRTAFAQFEKQVSRLRGDPAE